MKTLLSSFAGIPIVVSMLLGGHHNLSRIDLERALSRQMNGTAAGQITRTIHCADIGGSTLYRCVFTGAHGSQRATVLVTGGSWRATWSPLSG